MTPLDNPIWHALTSRHAQFGRQHGAARCYRAEFAPFAAFQQDAWADLAALLTPGHTAALLTPGELPLPDTLACRHRATLHQMVLGPMRRRATPMPTLRRLTMADADVVTALVEQTKPGPFAARTLELGRFLGVFVDARLVAMAGERMALDGFVEISAVCTHPDHRGRRYAQSLIAQLADAALARRETPFLHVMTGNDAAIETYRKLGFATRTTLHLTVISPVAVLEPTNAD